MTDCVVDTDVISFFLRHDYRAEPYRPYLEGVRPVISLMTLAEMQYVSVDAQEQRSFEWTRQASVLVDRHVADANGSGSQPSRTG